MGVYSLEAAERLAAKNKDTELLDESYMPYENPILEFGIMNLRQDFAMFEAMLEMDFGDYYQSLQEAPVPGIGTAPARSYSSDSAQERKDNAMEDKRQEDEAKAKATEEANAKKAAMNANLAKLKNTSGILRKIGEAIKKIWEAFKRGVANLFNRFFQSYDSFLQDKGGKFKASVDNLDKVNISEFDGEIKLYDIDNVIDGLDKIKDEWTALSRDASPVEISGKIEDLEKELEAVKNSHKNYSGAEAVRIIKNVQSKDAKKLGATAKDSINRAADEMERKMSQEVAQAKLDQGEDADKDAGLQQKREVTQMLVNFGNKFSNAYANCLADASAAAYTGAARINGFFAGKNIAATSTKDIANAAKQKAQPAVDAVKNKADEIKTKAEINKAIKDGVNNMESQNASADISDNDDVFTEAELCSTLGAILEDNAMIDFDECFEF